MPVTCYTATRFIPAWLAFTACHVTVTPHTAHRTPTAYPAGSIPTYGYHWSDSGYHTAAAIPLPRTAIARSATVVAVYLVGYAFLDYLRLLLPTLTRSRTPTPSRLVDILRTAVRYYTTPFITPLVPCCGYTRSPYYGCAVTYPPHRTFAFTHAHTVAAPLPPTRPTHRRLHCAITFVPTTTRCALVGYTTPHTYSWFTCLPSGLVLVWTLGGLPHARSSPHHPPHHIHAYRTLPPHTDGLPACTGSCYAPFCTRLVLYPVGCHPGFTHHTATPAFCQPLPLPRALPADVTARFAYGYLPGWLDGWLLQVPVYAHTTALRLPSVG